MNPPWGKMLTSKAVWAIILAHFAENWGFYTLLTGLPMFMRGNKDSMIIVNLFEIDRYNIGSNVSDVLSYKLDQAGFLAAFPYLLMAGIVQSAGVLADYARTKGRLTTTQVMENVVKSLEHKSCPMESNGLQSCNKKIQELF